MLKLVFPQGERANELEQLVIAKAREVLPNRKKQRGSGSKPKGGIWGLPDF